MDDDSGVLYDLACGCEALFDTQLANLKAQASSLADLVAEYQQRFAIWAAHLGVFARKSQSLDTRLRNHADIQDLVARLLVILRRSLHQLMRATEASGANGPSRVEDGTPRDTALSAIDATLIRLNRLGVAIRQSSRDRIDIKVQRFAATIDFGPFAAVSQAVVQQLYPNAHQSLRRYLAKTMVDRYASMLYKKFREGELQSRRPKKTLGSMPTIDEGRQVSPDRNPPGLLANNVSQQTLPGTLSSTALAGISPATSRSDLSTINSKQLRSTLYRTNNFQVPTERRKGTSSVQVGQGNYPRPPSKEGSNFVTCEWCSKIIQKREMSDSDWRRHIDEDLKPYTCISDACSDGHPAFPSFAPWHSHMKEHNRRWHQSVFPTSSWICAVCDDSLDIHTSPEALHDHLVQAHGNMFPACQLQAIARQSKVERQRPWNECLLCCFTVDKAEPPAKRRKEQLVNKAGNKSRRTSFATKHPKPERENDQDSDASDDSLDISRLALAADNAETMTRHIAAHLQALMLLTIRLALLSDDHSQETQDHANSASVDPGDSDEASFTESTRESAADTVSTEDVEMPDVDGEALEAVDTPQVDHISEVVVDFDGVPRQYDELPVEEDEFLQELIKSGAYQAGVKRHEMRETWDSEDKQMKEVCEATKAAAPQPEVDEDEEMGRIIREIEEADAEREKKAAEYEAKKKAAAEEKKRLDEENRVKNAAENDRKLREQEREMERLEDEREKKRAEAEAKASGKLSADEQPPSATPDGKYGRHDDIMPKNILRFRPGEQNAGCDKIGVLQISDFGLSEFHGRYSPAEANAADKDGSDLAKGGGGREKGKGKERGEVNVGEEGDSSRSHHHRRPSRVYLDPETGHYRDLDTGYIVVTGGSPLRREREQQREREAQRQYEFVKEERRRRREKERREAAAAAAAAPARSEMKTKPIPYMGLIDLDAPPAPPSRPRSPSPVIDRGRTIRRPSVYIPPWRDASTSPEPDAIDGDSQATLAGAFRPTDNPRLDLDNGQPVHGGNGPAGQNNSTRGNERQINHTTQNILGDIASFPSDSDLGLLESEVQQTAGPAGDQQQQRQQQQQQQQQKSGKKFDMSIFKFGFGRREKKSGEV